MTTILFLLEWHFLFCIWGLKIWLGMLKPYISVHLLVRYLYHKLRSLTPLFRMVTIFVLNFDSISFMHSTSQRQVDFAHDFMTWVTFMFDLQGYSRSLWAILVKGICTNCHFLYGVSGFAISLGVMTPYIPKMIWGEVPSDTVRCPGCHLVFICKQMSSKLWLYLLLEWHIVQRHVTHHTIVMTCITFLFDCKDIQGHCKSYWLAHKNDMKHLPYNV